MLEEMLQINVRGFKYEEEINKVEEEWGKHKWQDNWLIANGQ